MATTAAAAICSACGERLSSRGDCIACLLRAGLGGEEQSSDAIESAAAAESAGQRNRGATLAAGQRVGRYRIIREIGRGGMGAVYLTERADEQFKQRVAIKLIKRGMDTDAVLRQFCKERQILAGFDHPNIARLFDGDTTEDGLPYFIMEYVEGVPINDYCTEHALSINERLKLFREICAGVSYAHRHLVIHRDIKPSNILVTDERLPKLLDFGIAKILGPEADGATMATAPGLRLMTPEYASPEQVRSEPVTTASDVYSLGVVLYELLTGSSPYRFASRAPREIERAITEQEPTRPSTAVLERESRFEIRNSSAASPRADSRTPPVRLGPIHDSRALRGDLDNILLMALRKEPARRYQSVEQFSEDIRRHLEARPVLARRDTFAYRMRKFVQRNRVATGAALLILVSLIAGLVATTWEAHRARMEKARAERRFNDVRQLAHSVLFDYHDAIKNLPGATRARERLVKDALTYLDSLAKEAAGDSALQRELAAAYERVGDVRGEAFGASLGDRAGATESYRKAVAIREALVSAAPRDVQNRRDLAAIYRKIGDEFLDTAEPARGVEYLRKSLSLYSDIAAEQPARLDRRYDLAEAYTALGNGLESRGDEPVVLEQYGKALPIYQVLLEGSPNDRAIRRSLSVIYEKMGNALFLRSDTKGALEKNEKALALREALLSEDPTNADYRRIVSVSYQNNGDYRAWAKDTAGALESFRKKLAIDEQSAAADPANAQALGDLAYCNLRLGELLTGSGDDAQSVAFCSRAAELYRRLSEIDPQDQLLPIREAGTHARLTKSYAKLGKIDPAQKESEKASRILSAKKDDAGNTMAQRVRAIAYADLAEAHDVIATNSSTPRDSSVKHRRAARDMYRRELELLEDLQRRGILDEEEIPEIDKVRQKITECEKALTK